MGPPQSSVPASVDRSVDQSIDRCIDVPSHDHTWYIIQCGVVVAAVVLSLDTVVHFFLLAHSARIKIRNKHRRRDRTLFLFNVFAALKTWVHCEWSFRPIGMDTFGSYCDTAQDSRLLHWVGDDWMGV
mmetsp:Transcript_17339/g.47822  ORF Transcript_17339/g.47822 Transcript_17339/m.47822 type:complete len:128 (+) Transcript_17339:72-455(+)